MNAVALNLMLTFVGGRPMLILRDHTEGRIKVFEGGVWVATVIPGPVLGLECEAALLGMRVGVMDGAEERTTWGGVAHALSVYQQTGLVPCMTPEGFEFDNDEE